MFRWTLHLTRGPNIDSEAAVAVGDRVYSFGGYCDVNKDQIGVRVLNTVALCWRELTPESSLEVPCKRRDHTAVMIDYIAYIWGGYKCNTRDKKEKHCNVLYAFDVDTHSWFNPKVAGTVPEARWDHSACALGKVMFIHGGLSYGTPYYNDMYKMDTTTMVWSLINTGGTTPPASSHHSATIIGTKMFVFGGGDTTCNNILRVFDTETNLWLRTPYALMLMHRSPAERWGHSAFTYNGELFIFGGHDQSQEFTDIWKFSPETAGWKKVEPRGGSGPCSKYTMCCCIVGDRVILFGSFNRPDELHVLDLNPSLKTLCKLAVMRHDLKQSGLTHNIRWELEAMCVCDQCVQLNMSKTNGYTTVDPSKYVKSMKCMSAP